MQRMRAGHGLSLSFNLTLFLLVCVLSLPVVAAADNPTNIRVCTYNVMGFQGWPEEVARDQLGTATSVRLAHFTEVFKELDCDILGVQEAASQQWIRRLATNIGVDVAFTPTPAEFPGGIFSRFPILEQRPQAVTQRSWEVPFSRTFGSALLDVAGKHVWVVNLHAHPNRQDLRDAEAKILADTLDGLLAESPHAIVFGDFNSPVGTVLHDVLAERGFVNAVEAAWGRTVPTVNSPEGGVGTHSIDHVYVSESLSEHLVAGRIILDPGFMMPLTHSQDDWVHSDHVPVVAELEW